MRSFTRIVGVPGVTNFGTIIENQIYRSAEPSSFEGLHAIGIKNILNFQEILSPLEYIDDSIGQIPLRVSVFSNLEPEDFLFVNQVMSNTDYWPLLIHCREGHDRTGVFCAGFRIGVQGWTYEEAEEEMMAYGFNPLWFMLKNKLKNFVALLK